MVHNGKTAWNKNNTFGAVWCNARNRVGFLHKLIIKTTNKMELKIEHLAPYLPYGLTFLMESEPNSKEPNTDELKSIDVGLKMVNFGWGNAKSLTEIKPILKPLSTLTKELYYELSGKSENDSFGFWYGKHNGNNDKRDYIYHSGYSSRLYFICDGYGQFSYKMMEFFLKNKFDVFGLINAGLATEL